MRTIASSTPFLALVGNTRRVRYVIQDGRIVFDGDTSRSR